MTFDSVEYACLLLACVALSWLLVERPRLRVILLLCASYLFYASWNARYLALIAFSSSLDYVVARRLVRAEGKAARRALLALSLVVNLGILGVFKYFHFFSTGIAAILGALGLSVTAPRLDVALPIGISFYTFQTLSYTIDVYRREQEPAKSYFQYLLYVSFFTQVLAGPIVRSGALLPQIAARPALTAEEGSRAILRIGMGLVKKVAIADLLGAHLVNPVFSNPEMYSAVETLAAAYGYSFQIYADFSAYSDIAIGSAALLGFKIPENFAAPYRAADLREFWQRWHISLSTWLRDYLYIPLGGSRGSAARTYLNLMVTMLLGGLWHGAALTFVVWGGIHGAALTATRLVQRAVSREVLARPWAKAVGVLVTFHVVTAAWVFFRAPSFAVARDVFAAIGSCTFGTANLPLPALLALGLAVVTHWMPGRAMARIAALFHAAPAPLQAAAVIAAVIVCRELAGTEVAPFIYFQF